MEMVNIKINGMPLSVPNGISILEAARYAGTVSYTHLTLPTT